MMYEIPKVVMEISQQEEKNHYETVNKHGDDVKRKRKRLRLMLSIMSAVIIVHSVILLIFIAVASWKMVNLEKAIEEHEHRTDNSMESDSDERKLGIIDAEGLPSTLENINRTINKLSMKLNGYFSVAFDARLTSSITLERNDPVKYDIVQLNDGQGYNLATGFFTVPPGRAGLYYFLIYMDTAPQVYRVFFLAKFPRERLCIVDGDKQNANNHDNGACAITVNLTEGEVIYVYMEGSNSNQPLFAKKNRPYAGFTGFLLRPSD